MYLSLHGSMVAWRLTWREMAHVAAGTGYERIDMPRGSASAEDPNEVREFLAAAGVRPAMYPLPVEYRTTQYAFESGLATMKDVAAFASRIGCTGMSASLPASAEWPKREAWKIFQSRLTECGKLLDSHGLRLGIEFLSTLPLRKKAAHEFVWRMEEALEFAADCRQNTGIILDSWHWHHGGAGSREILAANAREIVHVHAADAADLAPEDVDDMERLMPGQGIVDFKSFFGALRSIGYRGGVSPEVFSRKMKELTPEEGARVGAESTRRAINC